MGRKKGEQHPADAKTANMGPRLRQYAVLHLASGLALLVTVLVLIWLRVRP